MVCGICSKSVRSLILVSPDEYNTYLFQKCLLYELLWKNLNFFLCNDCSALLRQCLLELKLMKHSRFFSVHNLVKGCFCCGTINTLQIFVKTRSKALLEVVKRFGEQHTLLTQELKYICVACTGLLQDLVKLYTIFQENTNNVKMEDELDSNNALEIQSEKKSTNNTDYYNDTHWSRHISGENNSTILSCNDPKDVLTKKGFNISLSNEYILKLISNKLLCGDNFIQQKVTPVLIDETDVNSSTVPLNNLNQKLLRKSSDLNTPVNLDVNLNKDHLCWNNILPVLQLFGTCSKLNQSFIELVKQFSDQLNRLESADKNNYFLNPLVGARLDNAEHFEGLSLNKSRLEKNLETNTIFFNFSEYDLYYHLLKEDPNFNTKSTPIKKLLTTHSSSLEPNSSLPWDNFWVGCETIQNAKLCLLTPISLNVKQTISVIKEISEELQEQSAIIYDNRMMLSKKRFLLSVNRYSSGSLTTMLQSIEASLEECIERLTKKVSKKAMYFDVKNLHGEKVHTLLDNIICDWYKIINNLTANITAVLEEGLKFSKIKLFLLPGCSSQTKLMTFFKIIIKLLNKLYGIYNEIESISVSDEVCDNNKLTTSLQPLSLEINISNENTNVETKNSSITLEKLLYNDCNNDLFICFKKYQQATVKPLDVEIRSSQGAELCNSKNDICTTYDEDELIFPIDDLN